MVIVSYCLGVFRAIRFIAVSMDQRLALVNDFFRLPLASTNVDGATISRTCRIHSRVLPSSKAKPMLLLRQSTPAYSRISVALRRSALPRPSL